MKTTTEQSDVAKAILAPAEAEVSPRQAKPDIREFRVDELLAAPFNPPDRVERKNLLPLMRAILEAGQILSLITVAFEGDRAYIGDGHRRHAAAVMLGITHIWCRVSPLDLATTWAMCNGVTRPINGREWTISRSLGLPSEVIPKRYRDPLEDVVRILGTSGLSLIANNGLSVTLYREATRLLKKADLAVTDDMLGNTILWLVRTNMQSRARHFADTLAVYQKTGNEDAHNEAVMTLLTAIRSDKAIYYDGHKWTANE